MRSWLSNISLETAAQRELWKILEPQCERRERWLMNVRVLFARGNLNVFGYR